MPRTTVSILAMEPDDIRVRLGCVAVDRLYIDVGDSYISMDLATTESLIIKLQGAVAEMKLAAGVSE